MKLPSFKRIYTNDYDNEYRSLIERLASSLNIGVETLYQLANKEITIGENLAAVTRDITVVVDASGFPTTPINIGVGNNFTALGCEVMDTVSQTNPRIYPTSAPYISFSQNGQNVIVEHITGLPAEVSFVLTVVVWRA